MRILFAAMVFSVILILSCTDRDDNLEGVQIRVLNATSTTFSEVTVDSLLFSNLKPDDIPFYQRYNGTTLPSNVMLSTDSLTVTVSVDSVFQIDTTSLNLFTYRIYKLTEETELRVEVLED